MRREIKVGQVVTAHDYWARCTHRRVVAVLPACGKVAYSVGDDGAPRVCSRRQFLAWARRQARFAR